MVRSFDIQNNLSKILFDLNSTKNKIVEGHDMCVISLNWKFLEHSVDREGWVTLIVYNCMWRDFVLHAEAILSLLKLRLFCDLFLFFNCPLFVVTQNFKILCVYKRIYLSLCSHRRKKEEVILLKYLCSCDLFAVVMANHTHGLLFSSLPSSDKTYCK